MSFLSPAWLLALIPWAALVIWILTGRRLRRRVPFLKLWDAPPEIRRPNRKAIEPPPLGVALLLLAILAAILAAAGPIPRPASAHNLPRITVLIDRGATMSAQGPTNRPRFVEAAQLLADQLKAQPVKLQLKDIPFSNQGEVSPSELVERASALKRTAADTTDEIRIATDTDSVIILSDAQLNQPPNQIVQVAPPPPAGNAGIALMSARQNQVMVRLRATTAGPRTLRITSGAQTIDRKVDLTPAKDTDVFLDLPNPATSIEARLLEPDAFDADERAWLARAATSPIVRPWTPLPEEIQRVLAVYAKHRPTAAGAQTLAIVRAGDDLPSDQHAILLAPAIPTQHQSATLSITDHPLTAGLDFSPLTRDPTLALAEKPPGEGWTILARLADKSILATREQDSLRRAWIGFDSKDFARTPAFVIFWTKLLDWTGGGGDSDFVARPLRDIPGDATRLAPDPIPKDADAKHWPGLFKLNDTLIAANTHPVTFPNITPTDWQAQVARFTTTRIAATRTDLRPWFALAALALMALAAILWERRRRQPAPSPRLVASDPDQQFANLAKP